MQQVLTYKKFNTLTIFMNRPRDLLIDRTVNVQNLK